MGTFLWGPQSRTILPIPSESFLMHDDASGRCQMFQVGIPEEPIIKWAIERFGDKTKKMIDCGAHMGAYSTLLAPYFEEIHAFEAQRRTFYQLCGNIFINEIKNIVPHNKAVTNMVEANQTMTLHVVSEDGGGSTLRVPQRDQQVLAHEKVKTTTIDRYHLNNVGLIKMDIEGNELKALHGAHNTLERSNFPPIIFEANEDEWFKEEKNRLFKHLTNLNYQIAELRPFANMFVATNEKYLKE